MNPIGSIMNIEQATKLTCEQATDAIRSHFGYKISPATLSSYRSRRMGPAFTRFGRKVSYTWGDVEAWVRSRTTRIAGSDGGSV